MSKTWCLFFLVALLATYAVCDESGGSGGSDESDSGDSGSKPCSKSVENKKEKGDELTECDEPEGSPECNCELTDGLEKCGDKITDTTKKTKWINFVTTIKTTILISTTMTTSQKFVEIFSKLEEFKETDADIYEIIEFETIKSYGLNLFVVKDLESIAISTMDETASSATSLDGSNNCNLFDAWRNASTNATYTTKITTLISETTVILQNTALTYEVQMAQIFDKIDGFCTANPQFKDTIEKSKIKNFYSVKGFKHVAKKYKQSTTKTTIISGDVTQVVLLQQIKAKYSEATLPVEDKQKLQTFYDTCVDFFKTETDVEKRTKKFAFFYYQFTKNNPGLQKHLDKIQCGSFGTISDLILVSTIVTTTTETSKMDALITSTSGWNNTIFIQSIYETYTDWNKTYNFQNLGWGTTQYAIFRNAYINNNISLIISDTSLSNSKKHKKISAVLQIYLDGYTDDTWFYCIPLGDFGFMADYKTKSKSSSSKQWKCPIPWDCVAPRQKTIEIKPDNTTDFCNAFEAKIATYTGTTKTQVQGFYDQMKMVIFQDTTFKKKPHKVSQLAKLIKDCKAAVPSVATDLDDLKFGNWGKGKKFCDCQDKAKVGDFK